MMQYLLKYKKRLAVAVLALFAAVIAVLNAVPGDQGEAKLQGVHDKAAELIDKIPDDAE